MTLAVELRHVFTYPLAPGWRPASIPLEAAMLDEGSTLPPSLNETQIVDIGNARELARRVSRSMWWVLGIPIAVAAVVVMFAAIASYQSGRNEIDRRANSATLTGDGWAISQIDCSDSGSGSMSGQLKNTSDASHGYEISVRVFDQANTLIGNGYTQVPPIDSGQHANWRASTSLVRFANGPTMSSCIATVTVRDSSSGLLPTLPSFTTTDSENAPP